MTQKVRDRIKKFSKFQKEICENLKRSNEDIDEVNELYHQKTRKFIQDATS